jgi:protein-disulfide isomerase
MRGLRWACWPRWIVLVAAVLGAPTAAAQTPPPLAEVNGVAITAQELEAALGSRLRFLEEQVYQLKSQQLDALITERLLAQEAARRGVSVAALLKAEVTAKAGEVTDTEVEAVYQANKSRMRGDEATGRQTARKLVQQQKLAARRQAFVGSLREQANVVVHLPPPPVVRVAVSTDGAPFRGAAEASVTLVEFSDFHCPYCRRVQAVLAQLLQRFPGKVKLVYRDYPLESLHPDARRAAEAARCAQDQGKFWEYHDVLFGSAPTGELEELRRHAERLALDGSTFERCLSTGVHRATVQRDIDEASRLGVTGTPAFFVNGRELHGAQPLEAFVRIVEEELARPGR